ncbi:MAG: hypothetical protein HY290_02120 [Planctomycetia bacterium]|nr:hypothetical protein [Planctomycetia bacterium]
MTQSFTPGFSTAAHFVERVTSSSRQQLQESNTFGLDSALRDELATVWGQCQTPNWDGFGALPVSAETLRNAYQFLEALPPGIPSPSVGAEPDGDLTLEWHRSPRRTLSISVSPTGDLHFAALFGSSRYYGTEVFFGDVPDGILDLIRRVQPA